MQILFQVSSRYIQSNILSVDVIYITFAAYSLELWQDYRIFRNRRKIHRISYSSFIMFSLGQLTKLKIFKQRQQYHSKTNYVYVV